MKHLSLRLIIGALMMSLSASLIAETVYIRDTLYVPLRGGQSTEYRILHRGLKSGTALERLEINEDSGYSRVKTQDGMEGWLQTQYLVEAPIASTRLESTQQQLTTLQAEYEQVLIQLNEAGKSTEEQSQTTAALTQRLEKLQSEYDALAELSANVIEIEQENQRLNDDMQVLGQQMEELEQDNELLGDDRAQQWFLYGGCTVLLGLLFGFWIGRRIYYRRHNSGWA